MDLIPLKLDGLLLLVLLLKPPVLLPLPRRLLAIGITQGDEAAGGSIEDDPGAVVEAFVITAAPVAVDAVEAADVTPRRDFSW